MVSNNTPNSNTSKNENAQLMSSLKDSAKYTIVAIVVALAAYFGWRYYQERTLSVDTVAADSYMDIQEQLNELDFAMQNPDLDDATRLELEASRAEIDKRVDDLISMHGNSIYAWQALMHRARHLVDEEEYTQAADVFEQALAIDLQDSGLQSLARLRYSAALLGAGDIDGALNAASVEVPMAFEPTKQELLGDIYSAQGEQDKAIRAYENAWSFLQKRQEERAILKLKMESLGLTPEPIEAKPDLVIMPTTDPTQTSMALQQEETVMSGNTQTLENAVTTNTVTSNTVETSDNPETIDRVTSTNESEDTVNVDQSSPELEVDTQVDVMDEEVSSPVAPNNDTSTED